MYSSQEIAQIKNKIFQIHSEKEFEELAIQLFNYQMRHNPIYTAFASAVLKGKTPKKLNEIPYLPIELFKTERIICQGQNAETIFLSSGTGGIRSKHLITDLEIYKRSFRKSFQQFYGNISDYCILSLLPNYRENQSSSLIFMIEDLIKESKHPNSASFWDDYTALNKTLLELEKNRQKTILFGVSYALLDMAKLFPQRLEHTTIIETGGTKGNRKHITKEELHQILKNAFILQNIHSEYGMTELLSQSYSQGDGIFYSPPWKKVLIRDINDPFSIVDDYKTGGINVADLANLFSCPFIATQDLGKTYADGGFSVLGRFDNADVRGCNLLMQ